MSDARSDAVSSPDSSASATPVPALDDVWGVPDGVDVDADCSPTKVCRNARDFTFDGIADGDDDLATSWRKLLEREGKTSPDSVSVGEIVLGPRND